MTRAEHLLTIMAEPVEYRSITGFPGYRVGSDGSVWSCIQTVGRGRGGGKGVLRTYGDVWRLLSLQPGKRHGYLLVGLCGETGRSKTHRVNVLVLRSFSGPPPDGSECRHKDGKRTNNRIGNLCWGTRLENARDRTVHGTILSGERNPMSKLTDAEAEEIRRRRAEGERGIDLASEFGVSPQVVSSIHTGRRIK